MTTQAAGLSYALLADGTTAGIRPAAPDDTDAVIRFHRAMSPDNLNLRFLPEVAELDLNPVIARPDGVFAVDARVRVTSHRVADPFLRQLRLPPAAVSAGTPPGGEDVLP